MDEKVLLDWKEAHADVYSNFKQDLEEQLLKPYHQAILDLGDSNAESLQSVIANFAAISKEDGFDILAAIPKVEMTLDRVGKAREVNLLWLCLSVQGICPTDSKKF